MTALPSPDWVEYANCIGADPDLFFPERGQRAAGGRSQYDDARAICAGCEVRAECLAEALATELGAGNRYGMFGGMTPKERAEYVRRPRLRVVAS